MKFECFRTGSRCRAVKKSDLKVNPYLHENPRGNTALTLGDEVFAYAEINSLEDLLKFRRCVSNEEIIITTSCYNEYKYAIEIYDSWRED